MKILIDIDALTPPLTGIGYYTAKLLKGLQEADDVGELKLIRDGNIIEPEVLSITENMLQSARVAARQLPFRPLLRWGYQKYRTMRFWQHSAGFKDFIYHAPNYSLLPFQGRSVVTIHDLSFIRHPEFHPPDRVNYWRKNIHRVVKRADHIITDSEFQRGEIIDVFDVEPDNVSAIHLGVSGEFRAYSMDDCATVLAENGLQYKQFCLVVATVEPRKNFERIVRAFESLPEELKYAYPLVIVGDKGWLSDDIHQSIERLIEKKQAHRLGYVPDEALWRLYASATVFVYPSLYEGFGLPVLEAMASGTAVLSSNSSSIPEVAGEACVLVDPYFVEQLTDEWRKLLSDETKQSHHVSMGLKRATIFTWDKCVAETINVYKKLDGG
ncbi:glycosyltransferase family 1 protein [Methylophaga sp.]|uniref:glycosyltransferase family 4 protein n=1 Tax=Methylophaga sp. TaxID=2024840 RepID=UPI0013FF2377|nr:glycosyltransferase family 1 protein [Methylophaga sp.]MTI64703.1 glycosyltransferase family 4 protein [Methylophaga sp.]